MEKEGEAEKWRKREDGESNSETKRETVREKDREKR